MDKNIGFCGYDCSQCAARSENNDTRQKLVEAWHKVFGHENYTAENVFCVGCRKEGHHADSSCEVRPCALEKQVDSCAECAEFPCRKISTLVCDSNSLGMFCHRRIMNVTREEFELASRPFVNSRQNIISALKKAGKLPDWFA